ncbi:MAG: GNAT family N-acetyltransferase [Bdellovibrionota bacterium]
MTTVFRPLKKLDQAEVISFVVQISDSKESPGFNWTKEFLESEFLTSSCFVLESQGQIRAFVALKSLAEADEITCLAVRAQEKRQGWGSLILTNLIENRANDAKSHNAEIWLEVHIQNELAQGLYTKFGFKVVGHRKAYYSDGGDAILMSLRLSR